ncbi:NIPSNAP family protein [Paraglaciecola sp. MB-3u-78]|nr:NIPSNAP family protein [Paraglaciecola sp. MB-3u-78]
MATSADAASQKKVYELRTYHTNEGKLHALQARFREHTHHIFERLGMKVVAYWIPTTAPAANNTLIYIIEHDSEADAKQKWQTFINDPTWKTAYQTSIKDGALVDSIDVVFMQKTDFSPEL